MSIFVKEKEHSILARCTNCHHGTEKGMPCRWCSKHRRVSTHLSEHEDKARSIEQSKFNERMRRGII